MFLHDNYFTSNEPHCFAFKMKEGYRNMCNEPSETWLEATQIFAKRQTCLIMPNYYFASQVKPSKPNQVCWVQLAVKGLYMTKYVGQVLQKTPEDIVRVTLLALLRTHKNKQPSPLIYYATSHADLEILSPYSVLHKAVICMFLKKITKKRNLGALHKSLQPEMYPDCSGWVINRILLDTVGKEQQQRQTH